MQLYEELHALTQARKSEPSIAPMFYSSVGDYWGRENEFHAADAT